MLLIWPYSCRETIAELNFLFTKKSKHNRSDRTSLLSRLSVFKYGFQEDIFTDHAILYLVTLARNNIHRNQFSAIFSRLKKAFDTVC